MKWTLLVIGLAMGAWAAGETSAKPAIVLHGKTKKQAMDALTEFIKAKGKDVKVTVGDDTITTERVQGHFRRTKVYGDKIGSRAFKFTEADGGVRIDCTVKIYTLFNGSQKEDEKDLTAGEGGENCMKSLAAFQKGLK